MQEEELSVSEILSSIRQVLSKEAEALNSEIVKTKTAPVPMVKEKETPQIKEASVLELTPQMRVAQNSLLSAETALKTQASLEKLNQIKEANLQVNVENALEPMLQDWLNKNLPDIVEQIVTREVRRLMGYKG